MTSPFTGGEVRYMQEAATLRYRKEYYSYIAHYYVCVDTGERFTTTELDSLNLNQVYHQYRVKYGIPFPDEIAAIRKTCGLSAAKMSEILGLGANQYRLYESGEMPSETIGKLLKSILNPIVFRAFVQNASLQFSAAEYRKILEKTDNAVREAEQAARRRSIFGDTVRSRQNGYAPLSYDRLKNILLFYIGRLGGVFNTKMNKLLFYTDFLCYKRYGLGMSGLSYMAIQYGPVPCRWNQVYGAVDEIYPEIEAFPSGYSGVRLCSDARADMSLFSENELEVLETVCRRFCDASANEISEISHRENAWIHYVNTQKTIDYSEAFSLQAL